MTSTEIRQSFLDFFANKEHRIVESVPVVPYGDQTLLFINAGMNQFKDVFLGSGTRDYKRAADTQKCIRVSGKHNDLEEVGVDTYHHTLFEMLGNWSFGDYYKQEAIDWAWELLTKVWKLDANRLYATVYRTDDEAYDLWKKYLPEDHIQRFDEKDNFWEMGATGPCGPCSEVHYDRTSDLSGASLVNTGSPDVIEIWNLVFIQFNRKPDGSLEPLASKFVDTGMGFERICSILQGVKSNYDTDIFTPIINKIEQLANVKYGQDEKSDIAIRVIADHIRTLSFAVADGALPGNEGRSYVLRRILRRGSRYARSLGFRKPMMYELVQTLIDNMGQYFKELESNQKLITHIIKSEEESFLQTMERGIELLDELMNKIKMDSSCTISGDDAFMLYDTFGFPLDLTELIARENGLIVATDDFEKKMNEQKERSRAARKDTSQYVELPDIDAVTDFVGYDKFVIKNAKILYASGNLLVFDKTPLYVNMGGQISDTGAVVLMKKKIRKRYNIYDVRKQGNAIFHFLEGDNIDVTNYCNIGDIAMVSLNRSHRISVSRNHSATHLLHEALRKVLGEQVHQAGSLVAADRLRFDFNYSEKISRNQLKEIEHKVNTYIIAQLPINTMICSIDEAKQNPKIKMFFGDKYGDEVRLVSVGSNNGKVSMELCGGTHVRNTANITLFKILAEFSVAAGIRRIEAVTGKAAIDFVSNLEQQIEEKQEEINTLKSKFKIYEREIEKTKKEQIASSSYSLTSDAKDINGMRVLVKQMELENLDQIRTTAETIRDTFSNNGICLIASVIDDKVQLACSVTDDLKEKYPAGKLVGEAAKVLGGGGGGKPHLATAGGKDISKLEELIDTRFYEFITNFQ